MAKALITLILLALHFTPHSDSAADKAAKTVNITKLVVTEQKEVRKVEEAKRPEIESVKLPSDLLDYIWKKSQENHISYELVLAIAKVESDFNFEEESSTNDAGMMQIHRPTGKYIARELNRTSYNLKHPKTSVDFAVFYLKELHNQWAKHSRLEEDAYRMTIISYNRGIAGASRFVKQHGYNNAYLKVVTKWKEQYEREAMDWKKSLSTVELAAVKTPSRITW